MFIGESRGIPAGESREQFCRLILPLAMALDLTICKMAAELLATHLNTPSSLFIRDTIVANQV